MLADDTTQLVKNFLEHGELKPLPKSITKPWLISESKRREFLITYVLLNDWHRLTEYERIERTRAIERGVSQANTQHRINDFLNAIKHAKQIDSETESSWYEGLLAVHPYEVQHHFGHHCVDYSNNIHEPLVYDEKRYQQQQSQSSYAVIGSYLLQKSTQSVQQNSRYLSIASTVVRCKNSTNDFIAVMIKAAKSVPDDAALAVNHALMKASKHMLAYLASYKNFHHLKQDIKALSAMVLNDFAQELPESLKSLPVDFLFSRSIISGHQTHVLSVSHGDILLLSYDTHKKQLESLTLAETYVCDERVASQCYNAEELNATDTTDFADISQLRFLILPASILTSFQNSHLQYKETNTKQLLTHEDVVTARVLQFPAINFDLSNLMDVAQPTTAELLNAILATAHHRLEQQRSSSNAAVFGDDLFSAAIEPPTAISHTESGNDTTVINAPLL